MACRNSCTRNQRIANRYAGQYEAYAVEFENLTQGLLLLETERHRSFFERGQPLVYVEAVSAAPWNRVALTQKPQFRGIGTVLLDFAQQRSLELGYGGRVGLESLPAAVGFYESRNMGYGCLSQGVTSPTRLQNRT